MFGEMVGMTMMLSMNDPDSVQCVITSQPLWVDMILNARGDHEWRKGLAAALLSSIHAIFWIYVESLVFQFFTTIEKVVDLIIVCVYA